MAEFDLAFPNDRRFDDRQLRIEDDGRDFESFVYEALSLQVGAHGLRPGFGRGRDGAIDHLIESGDELTVVECKFIGKDTSSGPLARWAEVRRHLNDNLPRLATANPAAQQQSPYRPWLNQTPRIAGYFFCVSYTFAHTEERAALERQIADDFLKLSSSHARLHHLANIQVQVRGWNDFHGELRLRFPLRYRWFGDLPPGIAPIRTKRFETRSFRRFLFDDTLPFFSREEFLLEKGEQQITREGQLVNDLSSAPGHEALILTGAGGVGKTRLGLELCDRLSKRGWLALRLTENAKKTSISELIKAHTAPAKVVLLLDYAERADDLSAIADEIALVNDSSEHSIRIIATCRISASANIQDVFAPLNHREVIVGSFRAGGSSETTFTEWVARRILRFGGVADAEQIAEICHGLPILATFALFLHKQDPRRFDEQFGDLGGARDFREWLKRRLDIVMRKRHEGLDERATLQRLALLALRLPIPHREVDSLIDQSSADASLLEMMRLDLWIEDEDDSVIATHDVLADAIAAHYIFEIPSAATTRLAALLRGALEQGFLLRALSATDRLANHPVFKDIDGKTIVRSLMAREPISVIGAHEALLRGRLLSDHSKVEILAEYPELRAAVYANRGCDLALSHIADKLARLRRSNPTTETRFVEWAADIIEPLLIASLSNSHPSNIVLRRAFSFAPHRFRSNTVTRISLEATAPQTHYLMVAWLYAGLGTEEIKDTVEGWLSANARRTSKASFLIRAWLDAEGPREFIDLHVLSWINAFGTTEGAQFVYAPWLSAGGNPDLIQAPILTWLNSYGMTESAQFLYCAWLNAGGQPDLIEEPMLAWITSYGMNESAQFLYRAWLDAGGRRASIDAAALAWIDVFCITENAQFLLIAWLNAGGPQSSVRDSVLAWIRAFGAMEKAKFLFASCLHNGAQLDVVESSVLAWIDSFGATKDAQFIYRAWLLAGGSRERIGRNLLAWIECFGNTENARFVYRAWLDAGGACDAVAPHLIAWVEVFGTIEDADFVYAGWLNAGGSFELIAAPCLTWFQAHATSYRASFVVKHIVQRNDLSSQDLQAAIRWCALFADHEEGIWRIGPLLAKYAKRAEALALVRTFLLNLRCIDLARLRGASTENREHVIKLSGVVVSALGLSLGVSTLDDFDRHELDTIHVKLLTGSDVYEAACLAKRVPIHPALIHHVSRLIERGLIDLARDRAALMRFASWMRAWPRDHQEDLGLAVWRLRNVAPSELWDELPGSDLITQPLR